VPRPLAPSKFKLSSSDLPRTKVMRMEEHWKPLQSQALAMPRSSDRREEPQVGRGNSCRNALGPSVYVRPKAFNESGPRLRPPGSTWQVSGANSTNAVPSR
jgi:hypothetical protein